MTIKELCETNLEALATLRNDGILLDADSLALNVERKIEAEQELTEVERGVLWLGITQAQVEFVRQHLL